MTVDQAIKKVQGERRGLLKEMVAAIPPKDLEVMTQAVPDVVKEESQENQKSKSAKSDDDDSSQAKKKGLNMLSFGDDNSKKKEKIDSAEAFKNVKLNQNDIVKKPGVSIWKVLNVRYQKSAWRSLLKKKKSKKKNRKKKDLTRRSFYKLI